MNALANLPKGRFETKDPAIAKAKAMLRRGKSESYISDYLGMCPEQVRGIRNNLSTGICGRPRQHLGDGLEAMSDRGCRQQDSLVRNAVESQNKAFLAALFRYGAKHGLPNLSRLQCLSELRLLVCIREEELALADRLEAEIYGHAPLPGPAEDDA